MKKQFIPLSFCTNTNFVGNAICCSCVQQLEFKICGRGAEKTFEKSIQRYDSFVYVHTVVAPFVFIVGLNGDAVQPISVDHSPNILLLVVKKPK